MTRGKHNRLILGQQIFASIGIQNPETLLLIRDSVLLFTRTLRPVQESTDGHGTKSCPTNFNPQEAELARIASDLHSRKVRGISPEVCQCVQTSTISMTLPILSRLLIWMWCIFHWHANCGEQIVQTLQMERRTCHLKCLLT